MDSPTGSPSTTQNINSNNSGTPKVESFVDEHEAFAASRVSQYVYVPTKDLYFQTLDQHADTLEGDVKPPLVLVGEEGSGKSALLANWVAKRREHKHRDEFLFQHFVGCTTQSLELSATLFRLETALKVFFQLREMKVPDTEVELRWSLNRFLEAASKKHSPARIVIIIDGVHRLQSEGTPDGTLYWLPTELPPCVRFIVSTVQNERNPKSKKENSLHQTYVELSRRQCPMLKIEPLGAPTRQSIVNVFINLYSGSLEIGEAQLFKIVSAQTSAQPMYLRSLLQALRLASTLTTLSTDELLDKFVSCQSAHELIEKSLNIFVQGVHQRTIHQEQLLLAGTNGTTDSFVTSTHSDVIDDDNYFAELLGNIMSVVYVSRSGLTENEIWGILRMMCKLDVSDEQKERLMLILKDFTMVVNDMYSFSHEIYREVVYSKYISSRNRCIQLHNYLARFFGQLPPCDRKLVSLPYHLEMKGSWSKVKNCLTDIEMFQLWWTPKFKSDFLKFWSSLTRIQKEDEDSGSSSGGGGNTSNSNGRRGNTSNTNISGDNSLDNNNNNHGHSLHRPSYDIVEEYVKSLDEYRNKKKPTDEAVAGIILEIGDFLLEFATLGYELDADVPPSIHPKVLNEDLKSLGVPYIEIDEDGRSSLVYPEILHSLCNKQKSADDGPAMDAPTKAIEDVPLCTNYYYHRWMWIQFPHVALGNCAETRYKEGIIQKQQETFDTQAKLKKGNDPSASGSISKENLTADEKRKRKQLAILSASLNRPIGTIGGGTGALGSDGSLGSNDQQAEMSKSWNSEKFKLPEIKFNRKAARSVPRVNHAEDEAKAAASKVMQRMVALQDSIQNYREEYDFVIQMKSILSRRLQDLKDGLVDLERTAESCTQFDGALEEAIIREEEAAKKYEKVKIYNKNLQELAMMCDRHPANVPALITELQDKIELDNFLLAEIKKRLWEQRFEKQAHMISFRQMKGLVAEAVEMHNKLLEYRYSLRKDLTQQAIEDEKALQLSNSKTRLRKDQSSSRLSSKGQDMSDKNQLTDAEIKELEAQRRAQAWEETWSNISSRTGIIEPEAFFQRMNNAANLEKQINTIKKTSESRLEMLKKEVVSVESELEEVRYEASFAGVQSSKEHKKQLAEKQQRLRQIKEKAESMEQLEQKVVAGLAHISDILFIPKSDDDAPVVNLIRDIEAVLDVLINEREKQVQQQQGGGGSAGGPRDTTSSAIPETHVNRSPELDFAIAKHESPKVRLPRKLPSKPGNETEESSVNKYNRSLLLYTASKDINSNHEDEDNEDEGTWDRNFVKSQSLNCLRIEAKKGAKLAKSASTATA